MWNQSKRSMGHVTKSSSAAGRTRRRLGNTSTCPYVRFDMFVLPSRWVVRPTADDDFVNGMCLIVKKCFLSYTTSSTKLQDKG